MKKFVNNTRTQAHRLLRKSEKYFKTDMVYLARGSFWLTAGQIASSVASFLLAIAFAHFVSKEVYGTYKYILSVAGVLTVTNLRGMATAVVQAVARGHEGVLIPALREKIRWGSIGSIASVIVGGYYYFNGNTTLAVSFLLISIFIPIFDSFGIYDPYLQGKKLFDRSTIYGTVGHIVPTALLIGVLFFTENLYAILLTYFASWTVVRIITFFYTIKRFPPNSSRDDRALAYGRHGSVIDIMATIFSSLDNPLLFHYLGAAEVAVYTFAMAPVFQITGLVKRIPTLAIPKMAGRSVAQLDTMLKKRMLVFLLLGIAFSVTYILFAKYFFHWFFPQYMEAIQYSQLFALIIPLTMVQSIISPALNAKLTLIPKKMLYLWNIPGIIGTIILVLSIGKLGITGAILSRIGAASATFLIGLFIWGRIKIEEQRNIVTTDPA